MALPIILGIGAAVAGVTGVGKGISGGIKMKEANDTMEAAEFLQRRAVKRFETRNKETMELMDSIGQQELEILNSFEKFSGIIEKIQGRPEFKRYNKAKIKLPEYEKEKLIEVSVGAGVLLGGLGGAAAGTAGGFAAAGVTTSAVMSLGTASTGTAIATLHGAAATNAALAAIGGGAVGSSATAGGIALGTTILGAATLGVGLMVGGIVFGATGTKLSEQADEAFSQAMRIEREVKKIIEYLDELSEAAEQFKASLTVVEEQYKKCLDALDNTVNVSGKMHWSEFTNKEKQVTENAVLLVGLLYKMCQINLVIQNEEEEGINAVNKELIETTINDAETVLEDINMQSKKEI